MILLNSSTDKTIPDPREMKFLGSKDCNGFLISWLYHLPSFPIRNEIALTFIQLRMPFDVGVIYSEGRTNFLNGFLAERLK